MQLGPFNKASLFVGRGQRGLIKGAQLHLCSSQFRRRLLSQSFGPFAVNVRTRQVPSMEGAIDRLLATFVASSNKCIASSNKCLTSRNNKLIASCS